MKTMRQYLEMCKTCNGYGQLADSATSTNLYRTCPVCNGSGVITITETITVDNIEFYPNFDPLKDLTHKSKEE